MSKDFPHPFAEAAREYRRLRRSLPMEVSVLASNHFKKNFRRQGSYDEAGSFHRWKPRKNNKRGRGRAILVRSGRLKRGIVPSPLNDTARVVNAVPYAQAHNEGEEGSVSVKAHSRNRYSRSKEGTGVYSVKSRKERMRTVRSKSGASKVRAYQRKMNLPARPFMRTDAVLIRAIQSTINRMLQRVWDKR